MAIPTRPRASFWGWWWTRHQPPGSDLPRPRKLFARRTTQPVFQAGHIVQLGQDRSGTFQDDLKCDDSQSARINIKRTPVPHLVGHPAECAQDFRGNGQCSLMQPGLSSPPGKSGGADTTGPRRSAWSKELRPPWCQAAAKGPYGSRAVARGTRLSLVREREKATSNGCRLVFGNRCRRSV